jgi:hypothetical protein
MFQDIKHCGLVTHVNRATGDVRAFKIWDATSVHKEEKRLRKTIDRMIRSVPPEERPKPSLLWTNTIVENLGVDFGTPIELEGGDPGTLTFAFNISGQVLLHSAGLGLLRYFGCRNVLIIDEPHGYRYVKVPGTTEETLGRLERDGVWKLVEHALTVDPTAADLLRSR